MPGLEVQLGRHPLEREQDVLAAFSDVVELRAVGLPAELDVVSEHTEEAHLGAQPDLVAVVRVVKP